MSAEARQSYVPVGRHVHSGKSLAYRKQDAGLDGNNRPGNYVVHFLLSEVWAIGLSDMLAMPDQCWLDADYARLKSDLSLPDIDLSDFRNMLRPRSAVDVADPSRIVTAVGELARKRSIDVSDWTAEDVLALLATIPSWVDYSARLIPTWSQHGPSRLLKLADLPVHDGWVEDRRWHLQDDELLELRQKLANVRSVTEMDYLLSGRFVVSSPTGEDGPAMPMSLDAVVVRWVAGGKKGLSAAEIDLMERDPQKTLVALDEHHQRIPPSRRLDPMALSLLERCIGVERQVLARILPIDDEIVSMYVAKCPNSAVLEAAVLLNHDESRTVDLVLLRDVASATMNHLVDISKTDQDVYKGLVRSVSISSMRGGSFARRLFLASGMDFEYLYAKVLPAAAGRQNDSLLSLACINPDEFVSWVGIPNPYAGALVEALRHETRQAIWDRISGFFGRWKSPWPTRTGR